MRINPQLPTPSMNGDCRNLESEHHICPFRKVLFDLCGCHKLQQMPEQCMAQLRGEIRYATICLQFGDSNDRIGTLALLKQIKDQVIHDRRIDFQSKWPSCLSWLKFGSKLTLAHAVDKTYYHQDRVEIELLSGIVPPCEWVPII